ncbi:hypothetical protein MRB53_000704 [Persea americana]|uniref:Uncharacterized protein n=1 Tax=Persea americana TaxID=3435 RepID=A0ACC2MPL1_PERAE|nr:hypothetical protein MRB53_000704 [Persea americana]
MDRTSSEPFSSSSSFRLCNRIFSSSVCYRQFDRAAAADSSSPERADPHDIKLSGATVDLQPHPREEQPHTEFDVAAGAVGREALDSIVVGVTGDNGARRRIKVVGDVTGASSIVVEVGPAPDLIDCIKAKQRLKLQRLRGTLCCGRLQKLPEKKTVIEDPQKTMKCTSFVHIMPLRTSAMHDQNVPSADDGPTLPQKTTFVGHDPPDEIASGSASSNGNGLAPSNGSNTFFTSTSHCDTYKGWYTQA